MEQSPSQANAPFQFHIKPFHAPLAYVLQIHFNTILPSTYRFQLVSFPQIFPLQPCMHLSTPLRSFVLI
jgi:hypothetical protein